ncbi:sortase [Peterkaempfera bronchialis]|uniref:sortase n=1 Tax=Peterkaempfera bronchialis TaxID=2126346 RepID=UPI003C2E9B8E
MTVAVQTPPHPAQAPATPPVPPAARPPRTAARYLARGALLGLAVLLLGLTAHLVLLSGLEHRSAQQTGYDRLRADLAEGTAPVAQTDPQGRLLAPGTPVALLQIPALGLRQVVFEGTTSDVLTRGPGHRRDTPLPGQVGTSVLMGRQAAYGGPFGGLARLAPGDRLVLTTGQGRHEYRVLGLRRAGDPSPPAPAAGRGRLVLVTAHGTPYLPEGVLRIDADLVSPTADTPPAAIRPGSIPADEQPMSGSTGSLGQLVLWIQALAAASVAAVWAWHRWGRRQTWIVFLPVTAAVGFPVADQVTRLLPNLL